MKKQAFSLVELSIVLVILGLLAGGVLSGQSLIRAAELKAVTSEYERYRISIQTFQDKYMALPGDMANATKFWPAASSSACPGRRADAHVGKETCDGNGNGQVNALVAGEYPESLNAWQHMANARLIEGAYAGVTYDNSVATNRVLLIGWNAPASKIKRAGWLYEWVGDMSGNSSFYDGFYGNALLFGGNSTAEGSNSGFDGNGVLAGILRPEEAWAIDKKLDDGKPTTGMVTARKSTSCVSSSEYAVNLTTLVCALAFKE